MPAITPATPVLPPVPQWVAVLISTLVASIPASFLTSAIKTGNPFVDSLLTVLAIGTFGGALHSIGEYVRALGWSWWPT